MIRDTRSARVAVSVNQIALCASSSRTGGLRFASSLTLVERSSCRSAWLEERSRQAHRERVEPNVSLRTAKIVPDRRQPLLGEMGTAEPMGCGQGKSLPVHVIGRGLHLPVGPLRRGGRYRLDAREGTD